MKGNLIMTVAEMADRDKWLELRKKGIGGSEAAIIVGMNPWKSAFQLWMEKTGQTEPEDISNNEYVKWGTKLEQLVAEAFCEETGKQVRRCGMMADEEYPYMLASVDRLVVGENAGLECKTANGFKAKEWEDDKVPDAYYIQCQWYMMVTGAEKWYIACLIGGNHFVWKEIARNDGDIEAIRMAAVDFWSKVQTGVMPAVDGSADCSSALADRFKDAAPGSECQLPSTAAGWLTRYDELKATEKEVEKQLMQCKNELALLLGNCEKGYCGERFVRWVSVKGRTTVDSKRLKAELPDVYGRYAKVGQPSRRFDISTLKEDK